MFSAIVVILLKCYKCKGCVIKEASSKLKEVFKQKQQFKEKVCRVTRIEVDYSS